MSNNQAKIIINKFKLILTINNQLQYKLMARGLRHLNIIGCVTKLLKTS
jgi:hypothetical protein